MVETCLNEIDIVILAGGQGTRLRSLFPDCPKILVPINHKPFLRHSIEWLATFGARRVTLALGYKAVMVQDYLRSQDWEGVDIETFTESEPLGTGGALRAVMPMIRSETALVMNGDSVTRAPLCRFVEFHASKRALISIVATYHPHVEERGLVATDDEGLVVSFNEKTASKEGGYINAGVYLIEKSTILEIAPGRPVSLEREVFPRFCTRRFYAMKGSFPFLDIGTPESYSQAGEFFRESSS